ncbi:uncharacterized protein [Branchiostoma lanceolatum]|uniref:uncharacterized protein n=1 Tax=Branchiostoma lanceolatum TaxID=7740 RepID=UPI0034544A6B
MLFFSVCLSFSMFEVHYVLSVAHVDFGTFVGGHGLVAVKELTLATSATRADEGTILALQKEADILARVCHMEWFPFIYGINIHVVPPYIVQEFVSCRNGSKTSVSFHYLLNHPYSLGVKAVTAAQARDALRQVARGVEYLHLKHILHNDIKSDNVLLRRPGANEPITAKLIDFGSASWQHVTTRFDVGEGPDVSNHIAPEVRRGEPVTPSSDVYSLGRLLEDVCRKYKLLRSLSKTIQASLHPEKDSRLPLLEVIKELSDMEGK